MSFRKPTDEDFSIFEEPTIASQLPVKVGTFTLTELVAHCAACGTASCDPDDLHGRITPLIEGVVSTNMAFLCRPCRMLTVSHQRIRSQDDRHSVEFTDEEGVWVRRYFKGSWWATLKGFFKRALA